MSMPFKIPDVDDFISPVRITTSEDDLKAWLDSHAYRDDLKAPDDEELLFYNGLPIGSRGNILAINGMAKSRKSVIASAIMSSAYTDEFLGFVTRFKEEPRILNFDTEQGYGHWLKGSRRVILDAGLRDRPANYHSYHTREASVEQRLELLGLALEIHKPDLCVIDGVTDLVYDLNSQEEATKIGEKLMSWSVKYNCLLIVIIHITKGKGYMTGALGTYLEKKCQTAIKCEKDEKDDAITYVTCQYSRDEPFKFFGITFDKEAGHYVRLSEGEIASRGAGGANGPETKSPEFRTQFLNAVFRVHSAFRIMKLFRSGIKHAGEAMGLGELNNKDVAAWVDYFLAEGLVDIHPDTGYQKSERIAQAKAISPEINFTALELPGGDPDDLPF